MKEHPTHKGYFVTEDGRVFSYFLPGTRGILDYNCIPRELKQKNDRGYKRLELKGKNCSVHRLVAETYLPNPDNLHQVNHKNEVKYDNRLENLEWCNNQYNNEYSRAKNWTVENIHTKEQFVVFNLEKWCRENKLDSSNLYNTMEPSPRQSQHKGFRIIKPIEV